MRPKDHQLAFRLRARLDTFNKQEIPLIGINNKLSRISFIEQLVESVRRIQFVRILRQRNISPLRGDPSSPLFDPLKAAILHQGRGDLDEAFWLIFLSVHFGKHRTTAWRLTRDVYGALGDGNYWTWKRTNAELEQFREWLRDHVVTLQGADGVPRHFGNHRKYETLNDSSQRSTGKVLESYIKWVSSFGSHVDVVQKAMQLSNEPRERFDFLYGSMDSVVSFGRTARFDYLTMVGKLGLASIEPGSAYMKGSTGPLKGARLLFGKRTASAKQLDADLVRLEAHLKLYFGMQVLEDALCNWQKSPKRFVPFRG